MVVFGCGNIGSAIAAFLRAAGDYCAYIADVDAKLAQATVDAAMNSFAGGASMTASRLDATDPTAIEGFVGRFGIEAIVSCLPFHANPPVARVGRNAGCHYFDLTEDVQTTEEVSAIAARARTAFLSDCGLAPGFVNIAAANSIRKIDVVHSVKLRVGACPQCPKILLAMP
jgi:saccharopine dehydrogenase-like NADP-dependent oxidoreductase